LIISKIFKPIALCDGNIVTILYKNAIDLWYWHDRCL